MHVFNRVGREALFGLLVSLAALFVLRSSAVFSLADAVIVAALALGSTLPFGWALVTALAPGLPARATRWALMLVAGYAASVLSGYFLGFFGAQWLYLPLAGGLAAVMLAVELRRPGRPAALLALARRPAPGVVVIIVALGVVAVTPLLAPLVQVTPDLYIDYTRIDAYYHLGRAQVLSFGAPASVWPDLAGVPPLVYPDFNHFWIGQLTHWSGADLREVYFVFYPVWLVAATTAVMYAAGRALTGATGGGYLAAALAFLVVVPYPYDTNPLLRNVDNLFSELTAARIHFIALRTNLSFGAGGLLLMGVALAAATLPQVRAGRTAVGLLVLAALLTVVLLRVRSHFFVAALPPVALLLLGVWVVRRQWVYALPPLGLTALVALVYWESSGPHFDQGTSAVAVLYGPFGRAALAMLPGWVQSAIGGLPAGAQPLLSVAALVGLRFIGLYFGLAILGGLVAVLRRRWALRLVDAWLLGVIGSATLAASLVGLAAWADTDGNWGMQALFAVAPAAMLLAVRPLWYLGRWAAQWLPAGHRPAAAVGLLLLCTLVTQRGAEAILQDQSGRAYPMTAQERDAYYWVAQNTPGLAVVAADPDHRVNADGETIATTNFLGGLTQRPVYVQRVVPINEAETVARRQLMAALLTAPTADAVRGVLAEATFDYFITYPDREPMTDLNCCLTLVVDGAVKVYRHDRDLSRPR